jgi:transcriptional regulator with XRE-family HTH domain
LPGGRADGIVAVMTAAAAGSHEAIGTLVKRWRERRHRSQLDVSLAADLSARHLSYIETGQSNPSRDMIERICDELDVPLRERNRFYLAAGFAPVHPERPFADLGAARDAVEAVVTGMEPNPAAAVNLRWDLLAANQPMRTFLAGLPGELAGPPVNMLRVTMHPDGLAPQVRNLQQWRTYMLRRVRRQIERTAATVFGSPRDVTLDEIAIETFFPADAATAQVPRRVPLTVPEYEAPVCGSERRRDAPQREIRVVVAIRFLPLGQGHVVVMQGFVRHVGKQMGDDVEPATFLVVGVRHVPGCPGGVRSAEHLVAGA